MILYDYLPSGNAYKLRLLFNQLQQPYRRVHLDLLKGESQTPEFLAKTPAGRVPAVEMPDGTMLVESNALLWHFARGTVFLPTEPLDQTRMLQWLFFEQNQVETSLAEARFQIGLMQQPEKYRPQLEHRKARGLRALQTMETHLQQHDFFVANRYTIADIALYAYTHVGHEGGFDLSPYPQLNAWLARVRQQPRHVTIDDDSLGLD